MSEPWSSGDAYEPYIGRWSRLVATEFVAWLDTPAGATWLDVGCGTGALTEAVLAGAEPAAVIGVEPAERYLAFARRRLTDPRVTFQPGDATAIPVPDATVDAVVSGLMLNFVPDAEAALAELARVVRPGGTIAGYVWDYAEGMRLLKYYWDAAASLDPAAGALDEGCRFPLCRPEPLTALFTGAGLAGVEVRPIEVPTTFADFDDYWSPFLGGQGPAAGHLMTLPQDDQVRLRELLRDTLPTEPDGTIPLTARAWAVRGTR